MAAAAERVLVRSRSQLLDAVADQADLVENLGRFQDDLVTEGRAMMSDVPFLNGDAFAERREILMLSLLMLDLDDDDDRIVDAGIAVDWDRMGRGFSKA